MSSRSLKIRFATTKKWAGKE